MSTVPRGISIGSPREGNHVDIALKAEELGYDTIWANENWGEDVFVRLTEAAVRTSDIRLGTAIANVFSRSPAVLAMASATLDRVSNGRFQLGLGTSSPKIIEDLHGQDFDRPVRRTHETAELISEFLTEDTDPVNYEGEIFSVSDFQPLGGQVPLYNAALGEANRRATGRLFDGWLPTNVPFSSLQKSYETVAEAATEVDRDPTEIEVAPVVTAAVSPDGEAARELVSNSLAYYIGTVQSYRKSVGATYEATANAVSEAWRSGDREAAAIRVTEDLLDDLAIAGTPEHARESFQRLAQIPIVDHPIMVIPDGVDSSMVNETMEALAPVRT